MKEYIVVDLETTGLDPYKGCEIIAKVLLLLTSSAKFKFCSVIFYHSSTFY